MKFGNKYQEIFDEMDEAAQVDMENMRLPSEIFPEN